MKLNPNFEFSLYFLSASVRNCILQVNSLLMNKYVITEKKLDWRLLDKSGEVLYYAIPYNWVIVSGYKIYNNQEILVLEIIWYNLFNPLFWMHLGQIPRVIFHDRKLTMHQKTSFKIQNFKIILKTYFYVLDEVYYFRAYGTFWKNNKILNGKGCEIGLIEEIDSKDGVAQDKMILDCSIDPLYPFVMNLMYWGN